MNEEYKTFENLIKFYLEDENAVINSCEIVERYNSQFIEVSYTFSKEYANKNDLEYRNRVLEILLKRGKDYEGLPIESFADINK